MHIYKFRILSDEDENFIRDIEIKSTQSFEDFHYIILESIDFIGHELASFYMCDRKWDKLREITLLDMMGPTEPETKSDDDEFDVKPEVIPIFIMKDSKINKFIDDPHQRLVYEYDFLNPHTFYIELLKIQTAEEGVYYPRCTLSKGKVHEFPPAAKKFPAGEAADVHDDFEDIKSEFSEENFSEFDNDLDIV